MHAVKGKEEAALRSCRHVLLYFHTFQSILSVLFLKYCSALLLLASFVSFDETECRQNVTSCIMFFGGKDCGCIVQYDYTEQWVSDCTTFWYVMGSSWF